MKKNSKVWIRTPYYKIPYYTSLNYYFYTVNLYVYINFGTIGFILALSLSTSKKH
jgi:hypothetical protein